MTDLGLERYLKVCSLHLAGSDRPWMPRTVVLLAEHRDLLERTARQLLEKETLDEAELHAAGRKAAE